MVVGISRGHNMGVVFQKYGKDREREGGREREQEEIEGEGESGGREGYIWFCCY